MSEANGVVRLEREGTARFQLGDGDPFEVDLFLFLGELDELNRQHGIADGRVIKPHIDLIRRWGGPSDCSAAEAVAVINKISELVEAKKKSTETPLSSAGSTVSTPS